KRQSEHLPPVRGRERHRLSLPALRNTRKEVCTLVHPRVLPFRYAQMRTRAYESVLSPHQGERTFFDKFRKDLPHLADVAVAVRVRALDVDAGGDVGLQRGEMPPELARFGEEYPSRQRAVFAAAYGEIAHAHGLAADVRDKRHSAFSQDVRRHRRDGGL